MPYRLLAALAVTWALVGCGPDSGHGSAAPADPPATGGGEDGPAPAPLANAGEGEDEPEPPVTEGGFEGEGEANGPVDPPRVVGCDPWGGDDASLEELHDTLSRTYDPIDPAPDLGGRPNRYTTARHLLFTEVERLGGGLECVYTGRFLATGPDEEPDHDDINCEHTWPRDRMADEDDDTALYEHQQSDMHHLYPSDSRTNSARGSLHFGEPVTALDRDYAPASLGNDAQGARVFMPRPERRGDVARGLLYYSARWGADIGDTEEAVLRRWASDDPPDERERARNDAIEAIQGNRNPFVDCPRLLDSLSDFMAIDAAPRDGDLPLP